MMQAEQLRNVRAALRRPLSAVAALSLSLGLAACDDNRGQSRSSELNSQQAQNPPQATPDALRPPDASPGAAPSRARIVGTWSVTEAKGGPATARGIGDKVEGTTYRFEESGKVTVAGAKQCSYGLQSAELKVDCGGAITAGTIEFRDHDQTIVWTLGANESLTLKKR